MTTITDEAFIGPVLPDDDMDIDPDPTAEHRDHLQRELDCLTEALDLALKAKAANGKLIKSLRAQRTPLERAIRAMIPRNQR